MSCLLSVVRYGLSVVGCELTVVGWVKMAGIIKR